MSFPMYPECSKNRMFFSIRQDGRTCRKHRKRSKTKAVEIALNLKVMNLPMKTIIKATGLSSKETEKLQQDSSGANVFEEQMD